MHLAQCSLGLLAFGVMIFPYQVRLQSLINPLSWQAACGDVADLSGPATITIGFYLITSGFI